MNRNNQPNRIADNPTAKRTREALLVVKGAKVITGFLRKLPVTSDSIETIHRAAEAALNKGDIVDLPDRFNDAFSQDGWIATASMSADTMREALHLYDSGRKQEAVDVILSWFQRDTIDLFGVQRTKRFNKAKNRWNQLQEALNLTFEERYWSAVPLILIACDGFASDVLGTSPFEKDADLTVFDSIVGHPTSLQGLIGKITKGVRKSTDDDLNLPLRHGILHGQSLGYANRSVCMKAWLLMIALVDWAYDKESEDTRRHEDQSARSTNFQQTARSFQKLRNDRRIMDAYEVRENIGPFGDDLDKNSPEYAIMEFLNSWKRRNYGVMAKRSVNLSNMSTAKMAGQLRRDGELIELGDFELRSVRQVTVARADAVAYLTGRTMRGAVDGEYRIISFRYTQNREVAMPADPGTWRVQEACMFELLHGRAIDKDLP